jgi:hypothetical protein
VAEQRTRVVIVGDLLGHPDRKGLLDRLTARHAAFRWEWVQAEGDHFNLPQKYFKRLLHELRSRRISDPPLIVVKLDLIHGKDANTLYVAYPDPILAPKKLDSSDGLVEWLLSGEAGIVPQEMWTLPVREAGLLAVLSKLIRNKSWNKDGHGHMWTQEDDLLNQAPVNRPEFPNVYTEALGCIDRATGTLLLTKGGSKTKKEWSINTKYLPAIKRGIVDRSFASLRSDPTLATLMDFVGRGPDENVAVDKTLVSERVLGVCRDRGE